MKKKTIKRILLVLGIGVICGGWYAWHEFNRKVKDLKFVRASLRLEASELIRAYETDEGQSNTHYLGKIIAVSGRVRSLETGEGNHLTVVLGEESNLSAVRCSMDSLHQREIAGLKTGDPVIIKGACTGFNPAELLGSDVLLNRCVLEK